MVNTIYLVFALGIVVLTYEDMNNRCHPGDGHGISDHTGIWLGKIWILIICLINAIFFQYYMGVKEAFKKVTRVYMYAFLVTMTQLFATYFFGLYLDSASWFGDSTCVQVPEDSTFIYFHFSFTLIALLVIVKYNQDQLGGCVFFFCLFIILEFVFLGLLYTDRFNDYTGIIMGLAFVELILHIAIVKESY